MSYSPSPFPRSVIADSLVKRLMAPSGATEDGRESARESPANQEVSMIIKDASSTYTLANRLLSDTVTAAFVRIEQPQTGRLSTLSRFPPRAKCFSNTC